MANSSIITLLKRKIKSEIVNDPLIVKAFGSPDYDQDDLDWSGEDVGNNYIFTWNQNPETITNQITFITLQVNIKNIETSGLFLLLKFGYIVIMDIWI